MILNQVGGERHEGKLVHAAQTYTDLPVLGSIGRAPELELGAAHLGLVPPVEVAEAEARIARVARRIEADVDLDRLHGLAAGAGALDGAPVSRGAAPRVPDVRIAVARDAAFCFYYPGDLEALEAAGARLLPFDTLEDAAPPEADGIFIGGGFPERAMEGLEANAPMRASLGARIAAGDAGLRRVRRPDVPRAADPLERAGLRDGGRDSRRRSSCTAVPAAAGTWCWSRPGRRRGRRRRKDRCTRTSSITPVWRTCPVRTCATPGACGAGTASTASATASSSATCSQATLICATWKGAAGRSDSSPSCETCKGAGQ